MRMSVSTIQGRLVALTRPLMTGPAMPKPAATILSFPRWSAACRENSLTIRSNCANSLLAKRCLKTGVSLPAFSEKSARLHFVPPTSPARITSYPRLPTFDYQCPVQQLRVVPLSAVAFEQKIGFPWAPAPSRILWHGGAPGRAPNVEDGIHKRPRRLDGVTAVEERGVAAETIVHQSCVRAARCFSKPFPVAEIHGDVSDAHLGSGPFGPKGNRNTFIGLNVENETIGFDVALAKNDVGRAAELDHDLRAAFSEALAGSNVEGDAGPAPVVDQKFARDKSLGLGCRIHAGFFAVAQRRLIPEFSGSILPANHRLRDHFQIEGADGLQHLQFFVAHGCCIKRRGRFHCNQGCQLQDVALNHVPERAGRFIETAAALNTEGFRCGDLHVVDVIPVPERLENPVAKPENEQVLHCVLAQVVIDTVDLPFV